MARKLYSYQRWSSAIQRDNTSRERQSQAAQKYAEENNYKIVEIVDDSVSAFRGLNSRKGALAAFLRAVEDGYIESNSILYCESLDRISRTKVLKAVGLFNDILELGITIVTGSDNKMYTEESVNENSMDLLQSILLFSRAHEESKTKQDCVNKHTKIMIEKHIAGETVNIQSHGSTPWWIDSKVGKYEKVRKHPEYWQVARLAIDQFMEGKSVFKVVNLLNEKFPLMWKGSKAWETANIRKLRINPAVYGLKKVTVEGEIYNLENYYPPLITEGQFLRLEQIRETTKYLGKVGVRTNNINLLAGMGIFRCGHCGSTMMAMAHGDTIRYLCEKGRGGNHGCRTWSLPGQLVEHCLMLVCTMAYIHMNMDGGIHKEDFTLQINDVTGRIEDISKRITNMTTLIANGLGNVEEIVNSIKGMDEQRKDLKLELEVLTRKQILAEDNTFEDLMLDFFNYAQWGVIQDIKHEYREKLRDVVKSSIGEVKAWKIEKRLTISIKIKGHEEPFTFGASDVPYNWGLFMGMPQFLESKNKSNDSLDIPQELLQKGVEYYRQLYDASMKSLDMAKNLLEQVGYPELNGKMFWPKK